MEAYSLPLDKEICDSIYPRLYDTLMDITGYVKVMNVEAFIAEKGYEPCISSRFIVTTRGSVTCGKADGYLATLNGTIISHNYVNYRGIGEEYWRRYIAKQKKDA